MMTANPQNILVYYGFEGKLSSLSIIKINSRGETELYLFLTLLKIV